MQPRMRHPAVVLPDALRALRTILETAHSAGVDGCTLALVRLRAGQINGCGAGVDDGARTAREAGVDDARLTAVAAWRESACFTAAERAALGLAEAATRLADRPDAVDDGIWDTAATHFDERQLAAIVLMTGLGNLLDRLDATTRQIPGEPSP